MLKLLRGHLLGLLAALVIAAPSPADDAAKSGPPQLNRSGLEIRYKFGKGRLRQVSFLPAGVSGDWKPPDEPTAGVEVALHCTGMDWNDHHAKKFTGGCPGIDLVYAGRRSEESPLGHDEVLLQKSSDGGLLVESHYLFFDHIPVVRRWTRIVNQGREPVGIEHASSAMLWGLANFGPRHLEDKLLIHYAHDSWRAEAQWQSVPPSRLGFLENGAFSLSGVSLTNLGSRSTSRYLPMGMAENRDLGVTWFWQIEHDGAWHWELSNSPGGATYAYLGGPTRCIARPGSSSPAALATRPCRWPWVASAAASTRPLPR